MKQRSRSRVVTVALLLILTVVLQLLSVMPMKTTSAAPVGTDYGVYSWPAEFPVNPDSFDLVSQPPVVLAGTNGKPAEPKFNPGPNWFCAVGTNSSTAPVFKDIVDGAMTVGSVNGTGSINNYFVGNVIPKTSYRFLTNGLSATRYNSIDSAGYFGIHASAYTDTRATVMAVAWEAKAAGNATISHFSPGNKAYAGDPILGNFEEAWESAFLKVWKVPAGGGPAEQLWPIVSQGYGSGVETSGFELQGTLLTTNFPTIAANGLVAGDRIYFAVKGPDSQPWWTMNVDFQSAGGPPPTIQLDITWGAMEFTCYDYQLWNPEIHQYETGWLPDAANGNRITVANNSSVNLGVEFFYTQAKTAVTGDFVDSADASVSGPLPINTGQSANVYLVLDGLPDEASWNSVTLGSVMIKVGGI